MYGVVCGVVCGVEGGVVFVFSHWECVRGEGSMVVKNNIGR